MTHIDEDRDRSLQRGLLGSQVVLAIGIRVVCLL